MSGFASGLGFVVPSSFPTFFKGMGAVAFVFKTEDLDASVAISFRTFGIGVVQRDSIKELMSHFSEGVILLIPDAIFVFK